MEKIEVTLLKPDFYDRFQCKGSDCRTTCCQEWRIDVDKKTYKYYHSLRQPKALAEKLKKVAQRDKDQTAPAQYGHIALDNGKCPFHSEKGLCELQLALGEEALSAVCKAFPRVQTLYMDQAEWVAQYSLTFSCEAVVELLLAEKAGIGFIEEKVAVEKRLWNGGLDAKRMAEEPLAKHWQAIQYLSIDILQDRRYTLEERLVFLGLFLQKIAGLTSADDAPTAADDFRASYFASDYRQLLTQFPPANLEKQLALCVQILNHSEAGIWFLQKGLILQLIKRLHLPMQGFSDNLKYADDRTPLECYRDAYQDYCRYMQDKMYLLENILVCEILHRVFPFGSNAGEIWANYQWLVVLFVLIRFVLIGKIEEDWTDQDLIDTLVIIGRKFAHSGSLKNDCLDYLHQQDLDPLAQMYTLIASPIKSSSL